MPQLHSALYGGECWSQISSLKTAKGSVEHPAALLCTPAGLVLIRVLG
jgi:hypothetical protein